MIPATITEDEYRVALNILDGWCCVCEEFAGQIVEPDARQRKCEGCGEYAVYGAEEALLRGFFTFGE